MSTKGSLLYTQVGYQPGDSLLFGKETAGLPAEILQLHAANVVRLPMREGLRSLNLSNTVAVMAYEALRQNNFAGLV